MKVKIADYDAEVEFPDNTPMEEVQKVLQENFPERKATWLDKYLPTVSEAGRVYKQEMSEGTERMRQMVEKPSISNAAKGVLGALQYGFSPLTAIAKGIVKGGIKNPLTAIGVPDPVADFAGSLGENAMYMLPYGAMVKNAMGGVELAGKLKGTSDIIKNAIRPPLEAHTPLPRVLLKEGINKPIISDTLGKTVGDVAIGALEAGKTPETYLQGKRVGQQLIDWIHSGDLMDFKEIPGILGKYGISQEEFATRLFDTYSTAGRTLGRLSFVSRRMKQIFQDNPEALKALERLDPAFQSMSSADIVLDKIFRLEQFRRGLLVTQLATSMRNIISQTARVGLGTIDDTFQGLLESSVGGKGDYKRNIGAGLDMFTALVNRFRPSQRKELEALLNIHGADIEKMRLLTTPVQETVLGKTGNFLNTFNRTQEFFFRKLAFEGKLRQQLRKAGKPVSVITGDSVTSDMLKESVDYALAMTFAASPKGKLAQNFVQLWSRNPMLTAFVNPFPRFAFANALPFMKDFSPISFISAFSPKTIAHLVQGQPEQFAKSASQATLGSLMLSAALWYRSRPDAQAAKHYEVNVGKGRYVDLRAFAPFNAYLFVAEAMLHPEKLSAADFAQSVMGLNRAAGSTGVIVDFLRSTDVEDAATKISILTGAYLNGFTVPFRTLKDVYAQFDPKERIIRSVKEKPLISSPLANIPIASQQLSPAVSPMKPELPMTEHPLMRQLTGISVKTKTAMEEEVDRLGIEMNRIYPRTGVPEADRIISSIMGNYMPLMSSAILSRKEYQGMTNLAKKYYLLGCIKKLRQESRKMLRNIDPKLDIGIRIEAKPEELEELYRQQIFPNE